MFVCAGLRALQRLQGCSMKDLQLGHQLSTCSKAFTWRLCVSQLCLFLVAYTSFETEGSADAGSAASPSSGLTVFGTLCVSD